MYSAKRVGDKERNVHHTSLPIITIKLLKPKNRAPCGVNVYLKAMKHHEIYQPSVKMKPFSKIKAFHTLLSLYLAPQTRIAIRLLCRLCFWQTNLDRNLFNRSQWRRRRRRRRRRRTRRRTRRRRVQQQQKEQEERKVQEELICTSLTETSEM